MAGAAVPRPGRDPPMGTANRPRVEPTPAHPDRAGTDLAAERPTLADDGLDERTLRLRQPAEFDDRPNLDRADPGARNPAGEIDRLV